jgi:uncharacterized protein
MIGKPYLCPLIPGPVFAPKLMHPLIWVCLCLFFLLPYMLLSVLLVVLIVILIDIYAYRGMRKLFSHGKLTPVRSFVLKTYWLVDIAYLLFALGWTLYIRNSQLEDYVQYRKFFLLAGGFALVFVPKFSFFVFTVFYDLKMLLLMVSQHIFASNLPISRWISRWRRSLIVPALGLFFAALSFSLTLYGMGFGRYDFQVETKEVWFENLPLGFDGYRIVQFSDTHLGSYSQTDAVKDGLQVINMLEPDLIVFTGDMVNNEAQEAKKFLPLFRELKARDGLFSILGNHDMGDYRRWGTITEKDADIRKLVDLQQEMGFHVLLNDHRFIRIGNDSIMLAGVENWGLPPFGQYGDLEAALGENAAFPFKILLSHDPSHWREQVIPQTDIQLTLSGHTHGMQFGVTNRFFSWSPVKLKYNEWSGLYKDGNQKLYVNRGFGYLSFPGRIGMPPEITLIVLRSGIRPVI